MSEPVTAITTDKADEIRYGSHSQKQMVEEHRWYTEYLIVFDNIGGHYGFFHMDPASEMQEGQDEYALDSKGKVPVYRVEGHDKTIVVWKVTDA